MNSLGQLMGLWGPELYVYQKELEHIEKQNKLAQFRFDIYFGHHLSYEEWVAKREALIKANVRI